MAKKSENNEGKETICYKCNEQVDKENDKYVLLGTYNKGKTESELYFHFYCFKEWYDKKVSEKARNNVSSMQGMAQNLFGKLSKGGFFNGVSGVNQLGNLLGTDLSKSKKDKEKEKEEEEQTKPNIPDISNLSNMLGVDPTEMLGNLSGQTKQSDKKSSEKPKSQSKSTKSKGKKKNEHNKRSSTRPKSTGQN